jgi:hypothetical protein
VGCVGAQRTIGGSRPRGGGRPGADGAAVRSSWGEDRLAMAIGNVYDNIMYQPTSEGAEIEGTSAIQGRGYCFREEASRARQSVEVGLQGRMCYMMHEACMRFCNFSAQK